MQILDSALPDAQRRNHLIKSLELLLVISSDIYTRYRADSESKAFSQNHRGMGLRFSGTTPDVRMPVAAARMKNLMACRCRVIS